MDILRFMAKVLISVPDDLLRRIDREATARGSTRSRFLQEAALRQLGWPTAEALDAAVRRGRAALARAGAFESADLVRRDRRARDAADRRRR
jgi:predicted transcriptional regulator